MALMRTLAAFSLALALLLAGCTPTEPVADETHNSETAQSGQAPNVGAQDDPGVQVISPAAGGASPVVGAENVGGSGGGSGVGQAAKDKARDVAGGSGSSLDQLGGD